MAEGGALGSVWAEQGLGTIFPGVTSQICYLLIINLGELCSPLGVRSAACHCAVTAALGALSSTSPGVVQLSFSLLPSSILNRLGKLVNEIAHSRGEEFGSTELSEIGIREV